MAVKERSFWSTTSGLVTGLAGTITGVVALVTTAVQLGWVGGDNGDSTVKTDQSTAAGPATTTAGGAAGGGSGSGSGAGSGTLAGGTATLDLSPSQLTFEPLDPREKVVKVRNTGAAAATLQPLVVEGPNKDQFTVDQGCSGTRLDSARSCDIKVTFKPPAGPKTYTATLVVRAAGVTPKEVPLQGKVLV